jgi:hypothetical protein
MLLNVESQKQKWRLHTLEENEYLKKNFKNLKKEKKGGKQH